MAYLLAAGEQRECLEFALNVAGVVTDAENVGVEVEEYSVSLEEVEDWQVDWECGKNAEVVDEPMVMATSVYRSG